MKITNTKYKDIDAIAIDNGKYIFTIVPESGMKTASIIDKNTGFEFLHQNPKGLNSFIKPEYGGDFVEYECAGFDDMFPTIDPYYGDEQPWKDVFFPNHGEVWCQPYTITDRTEDFVTAQVSGMRMPYTLEKKFTCLENGTLRIYYTLTNPTQYTIPFIWAAHVMLNAQNGSQFKLPEECKHGVCMFSNNDRLGGYDDKFTYPECVDAKGVKHDLSTMRPIEVNADEKYYITDRLTKDGYIGVTYPENKKQFMMKFPTDIVPYVGIMNDEGGWDGMYLCILEPCTAPYDRPDFAKLHNCCSQIEPNSKLNWYLDIEISDI